MYRNHASAIAKNPFDMSRYVNVVIDFKEFLTGTRVLICEQFSFYAKLVTNVCRSLDCKRYQRLKKEHSPNLK